jgi:AmpD protein
MNRHTPLKVDDCGDWFADAQRLPSPNCDARPSGTVIDLAIVHGISLPPGRFGGGQIAALFLNKLNWEEDAYFHTIKGLRVSSHLLVERCGTLTQFVPLSQRAWHAGQSQFDEREACNDFSIGIELEGTDHAPYTAIQYHVLAEVLTTLMAQYPDISMNRIVGHCHVAPGRKTDPGTSFRWDCLAALLGAPTQWQPAHQL